MRTLVRQEIVNEARRSADLLWAISRPDEFLSTVRIDGVEHVTTALAAGRGVLLAGIHVGGWEVAAGVPATVVPVPTTVVVADDWLAWAIGHIRTRLGLRVAYRTDPAVRLARVLRRGEALLVLGDDASGLPPRTHRVELCGSPALLPAGIAALSRIAAAPIVTFDVLPLDRRRWHVRLGEPIPPPPRANGVDGERRTLQCLADRWTVTVTSHPDQWAARFPIAWDDPA